MFAIVNLLRECMCIMLFSICILCDSKSRGTTKSILQMILRKDIVFMLCTLDYS